MNILRLILYPATRNVRSELFFVEISSKVKAPASAAEYAKNKEQKRGPIKPGNLFACALTARKWLFIINMQKKYGVSGARSFMVRVVKRSES